MKENNMPLRLSITHITERIIAMIFPSEAQETTYKSSLTEVSQVLRNKHGDSYLMINLSERRNDMHNLHKQVIDFGWPEMLAPPLERLCNICKSLDSWLNRDSKNIVVIHCKGGLGRLSVVLSAYIDYSSICASEEQSLDQYSMKHFYESKLVDAIQPSQRRYVHYFAGLLSGTISINDNPLFLHQIVIRGIPNFDGKGGCCPYIKIYQGMKPVYISGVFSSSSSSNQIIVTLDPCLQLRSDILVKCYNKSSSSSQQFQDPSNREIIFRCQFHTCAISNNLLKFGKSDLDEACLDSRFPSHGNVEFVLSDNTYNSNKYECQPYERNVLIGTSPESIQRCNSYERFAGPDEDVVFKDMTTLRSERRSNFYNENHNHFSKNYDEETTKEWRQNMGSLHSRPDAATSDKWNMNHVERKLDKLRADSTDDRLSSSAFTNTNNLSRVNVLKSASSREMLSDEQSQAVFSSMTPQTGAEQHQLDDILKELLEEPVTKMSSATALMHRNEPTPPSHGAITTESDRMRTTLSWQTSQAGGSKSAQVTRQTVAAPLPHSKLASEVTRYREVTGDEDHIVGGKLTSSENYSCRMPGFQETRKVEMLSESKIGDRADLFDATDQKYSPLSDASPHLPIYRQKSLNDSRYGTYSGRSYASDSEDQLAWLESRRNKLKTMNENKSWKNKSSQEKQLVAELKSAQGAYYKTKRAQSDTEDLDPSYRNSYRKTNSKLLPFTVQEYRDSKGRRCQTIETETFSRRCETTTNQASANQAITNPAQKQLLPPPRSSTPSTPVIPDRGESSREAYLRNQYTLKPIADFNLDSDVRSHSSLSRPNLTQIVPTQPVEVEIVSLQPIGAGVQTLEPTTNGTGTFPRTPALTYPNQGTMNREYTMSSSASVPASLSNLQPPPMMVRPTNQSQTLSRTEQFHTMQQPAAFVPSYQHQTLQRYEGGGRTESSRHQVIPTSFTPQPVLQTYKETQTWSTTNTAPPTTLQRLPAQIGGSVQHLSDNQTIHRSMNTSVDGRSVPVLIHHDRSASTIPTVNHQGQNVSQFTSREQRGFFQQPQQQQQQQQIVRQQFTQQSENAMGTMRSASSQNHLLVEGHPAHVIGGPSSGSSGFSGHLEVRPVGGMGGSQTLQSSVTQRYRTMSSGGGMYNQQSSSFSGGRTRADSFSSGAGGEAYEFINQTPKFIRDTSKMWHCPTFTREDAIQYLKDKPPGSFVIRNSSTYPGSYGLTLRVAQVPSNVPLSGGDPQLDLVRHFIIEPTAKGVQLKGSANEPPFASLAAFVYQHSITPLSLPCKLLLPESDGFETSEFSSGVGSPLSPSAACNVLYIGSLDTESLTGPEALSRALDKIFNSGSDLPKTQEVSFKASAQGITITDNKRRMFFRRHYPLNTITYLGLDNQEQKWAVADFEGQSIPSGRVFGFVARKQGNVMDNSCHLFAELDASQQPAQTLINFITQIMVDQGRTVTTTST